MATNTLMRPESRFPALFDEFFKPFSELLDNGRMWSKTATLPAVNISESQEAYKLTLAAPGLKSNDFKIDIQNNLLTLSAEKEVKGEEKEDNYTRKEYSFSSFSRSFTLPDDVKQENIEATYTDGILNLVLPKKEESRKKNIARQIEVK